MWLAQDLSFITTEARWDWSLPVFFLTNQDLKKVHPGQEGARASGTSTKWRKSIPRVFSVWSKNGLSMQLHFFIITTEAAICPPTSFLPVFKIGLQFLLRHQFTPIGNIFVSVPLHQGEAVLISVSDVCYFQAGYLKEPSCRGRLPFCPKAQEWWPVVPQPLWTVRWPWGWR